MENVLEVRPEMQEAIWHRMRLEAGRTPERFCPWVMEAERDLFLGCGHHERSDVRRGWRNGYEGRWLETPFGVLRLRTPRPPGASPPQAPGPEGL